MALSDLFTDTTFEKTAGRVTVHQREHVAQGWLSLAQRHICQHHLPLCFQDRGAADTLKPAMWQLQWPNLWPHRPAAGHWIAPTPK